MTDQKQFNRWRAALKGGKLDLGERYDPPSGFYRMKRWRNDPPPPFQRTLALWRDNGKTFVDVNFQGTKEMTEDQADDLFANPDLVAIPYQLYSEVSKGFAWPDVHTTYLRTKDIKGGVVWTEEWSRKQLAAQVETHDENGERRPSTRDFNQTVADRAARDPEFREALAAEMGHNGPPKDDLVSEIKARLQIVGEDVAKALKSWGGRPRDKGEADRCADFINTMRTIYKDAEHHRVNEKEVFLKGGREVDSKWKGALDEAKRMAEKLKGIASEWLKLAEAEAEKVAAAAREKAMADGVIEAENTSASGVDNKITIGTGRQISIKTREFYQVTDPKAFFDHLFEKGIDISSIMVEAHKLANKLAANGLPVPGVERIKERKAS